MDHPTVGHHQGPLPRAEAPLQGGQRRIDPGAEPAPGLPAARGHVLPGGQGAQFVAVAGHDLLPGEPFPAADVHLPPGRVGLRLQPGPGGGGPGPLQVGGHHHVEGDPLEAFADEGRLLPAALAEADRALALPDAGGVGGGLPVADEPDLGHGASQGNPRRRRSCPAGAQEEYFARKRRSRSNAAVAAGRTVLRRRAGAGPPE